MFQLLHPIFHPDTTRGEDRIDEADKLCDAFRIHTTQCRPPLDTFEQVEPPVKDLEGQGQADGSRRDEASWERVESPQPAWMKDAARRAWRAWIAITSHHPMLAHHHARFHLSLAPGPRDEPHAGYTRTCLPNLVFVTTGAAPSARSTRPAA